MASLLVSWATGHLAGFHWSDPAGSQGRIPFVNEFAHALAAEL